MVFEDIGNNHAFGRKDIMRITGITISPAGTLIRKLLDENLIIPVEGKGKGKYMFDISIE